MPPSRRFRGSVRAATLVGAFLVASSCSSSHSSSTADSPSTGVARASSNAPVVTIGKLTLTPNPDSVLSDELEFTTSAPTTVTLHLSGPEGERTFAAEPTPVTDHRIPVVGMRARTAYAAWVTAPSGSSNASSDKVTITTGALPADFPPLTTKSDPTRMAPGVTLFTVTRLQPPAPEPGVTPPLLGYLVAVDATGHVVWYHRDPEPAGDARMLPNGDILYEYNDMGAREIDVLGNVVHEWAGRLERGPLAKDQYGRTVAGPNAIPVDVDSMHHELSKLANGDLLTITTQLLTLHGFTQPQCGEPVSQFNGSYQVIIDAAVELNSDTGKVVQEWPLNDVLHPQTNPSDDPICGPSGIPPESAYPLFLYAGHGTVYDYTHMNAVIVDRAHNALLVSIRHLDTVMAMRYRADANGPAGAVLWRFGPRGGDFTMTGSGLWQYHQHAIELESDGSLMMFDNGNDRPGAKTLFSRAVRYTLGATAATGKRSATQVWEYRPTIDGATVYAFFVGDADRLANGDVLVDAGGITPPVKGVYSQITEVVPSSTGEGGAVVFDLRVGGPPLFVYRAERLPSLYGSGGR